MSERPVRRRVPWWRPALLLIGLASAAYTLSRLDGASMVGALQGLSAPTLALAAGAMSFNMATKAWRWHRMLAHRGFPLPVSRTLPVFLESQLWGSLTIGRAGELYRVAPLSDVVPLRAALASVLLDRALDLGFLAAVALASMGLVTATPWVTLLVVVFTVLVLIAVGSWGAPHKPHDEPVPSSRVRLVLEETKSFFFPRALLESGLWTVISWSGSFAVVLALAHEIAPSAGVVRLLASAFFGSLSTLVPVTYQGLGTREPIFAAILAGDGVSPERAVLLALLVFSLNFVVVMMLGLGGLLWRRAMGRPST